MGDQERAALRELLESNQVTEISEEMRRFVELEMPELAHKLPPRITN